MKGINDFEHYLKQHDAVLAYFSHDECNVCKVLKPKLIELINEQFPKIQFIYINVKDLPEISAQLSIFTVPTIVIYFEGKNLLEKAEQLE